MATLAGGRKFIADLQDEEPHLLIAAGTGGGKTSAASVAAAHTRAHGWLVDIIDPKRRSYIDRKTGDDVLTDVPGIRVHTSIEAMMWALEEFFLSMLGVNIAVGNRTGWPGAFPQRLLIFDEFGTFAALAARMRAGQGHRAVPALDQRRQIEWQGRQAGHRLVVAVHQPNLRLFGDSDSRAQTESVIPYFMRTQPAGCRAQQVESELQKICPPNVQVVIKPKFPRADLPDAFDQVVEPLIAEIT